jgi:hypothetical protein
MTMKKFGALCLGVYLIVISLSQLAGFSLGSLSILVPVLGLIAGILILIGR